MKLDIGHIHDYREFSDNVNFKTQMNKVREEFLEFSLEVYKTDYEHDRMAIVDEGLDLMVATFNLISKLGLDEADLDRHKKKLEEYKRSGKHGKMEG